MSPPTSRRGATSASRGSTSPPTSKRTPTSCGRPSSRANPTRRSDFFPQSRGVDGARSLPLRGHKPLDPDQGLGIDDAPGPQVALQVVEGDLDDADDLAFARLATSGATPGRLRDLGVVEDDALRRSPGGHVEGGDVLNAVDLVSALLPHLA